MSDPTPKKWQSPCGRFRISRSSIGYTLWDEESGCSTSWREFLIKNYASDLEAFEAAKAFAMKEISEGN